MILADLDDFKLVNDRLGHPVGDELLIAFANALRAHLRDVDVPARLGGEEFAVLLPETTLEGAVAVADRLQRFLSSEPLLVHEGEPLIATASFGVADFAASGSGEDLFRRADAALYQAKSEGKNRVVAAARLPA
jgi:diguanylate cyclase (GGDEF)-like protein